MKIYWKGKNEWVRHREIKKFIAMEGIPAMLFV